MSFYCLIKVLNKGSTVILFIFISTIYIIKFSNYLCLRRVPEKYITGAMAPVGSALNRAGLKDLSLLSRTYKVPGLPRDNRHVGITQELGFITV
jgi:hypothetical protein